MRTIPVFRYARRTLSSLSSLPLAPIKQQIAKVMVPVCSRSVVEDAIHSILILPIPEETRPCPSSKLIAGLRCEARVRMSQSFSVVDRSPAEF
jgi:hypothetical protein